jgi:hypothetical protein
MTDQERSPRHSAHPLGNETFMAMLRRSAVATERAMPKPDAHGEPIAVASKHDMRDREIAALRADVAALRCSLARLETIVANLSRERT